MFTRKGISRLAQGLHQTPEGQPQGHHPDQAIDPSTSHAVGQAVGQSAPLGEPQGEDLTSAKVPPPPLPDTTVIGKNFQLEGENIVIRSKGPLAINGNVNADIHCEQLSIGDSAHVTGTLRADEIDVFGQVEGTISGAQVTLHTTANVEANINSEFLSIERGARFDGRSSKVADVASIAPQLMSSANDEDVPAQDLSNGAGASAASHETNSVSAASESVAAAVATPSHHVPESLEPSEPPVVEDPHRIEIPQTGTSNS